MVHVVTCVFVILASLNVCVAFNTLEFQLEKLHPREVRQSISADCTMGADRGPCRNYTVKWFYDIPVGCTRFWYGGCGGNGNRYESKEECEGVCVEPPGKARCNLVKDVGPCDGYYPRWYYDNTRNQCAQFVYGGCLGNNNRFESYEKCSLMCAKDSNIATDAFINVEKCANYCAKLRCPYGVEVYNDTNPLYTKCHCHDPCKHVICDEGSQCAVDLNLNRTSAENRTFVPVCRGSKAGAKPGECPEIKQGNFLPDCHKECRNDADCALDLICCSDGCSRACLKPASTTKVPQQLITTTGYYRLQTTSPLHEAFYPPQLIEEEFEPELFAGEGDYITLKCPVKGNPKPTITWSKETIFIGGSEARFRVLDGALQIVPLYKTDSGIYHCTADNKIGQPIKKKITLEVLDSVDHPARILNAEVSRNTVVSLGSNITLDCFAYGYPIPVTTWWMGDRLLPLKSSEFAISSGNALLIYAVKPHNLGLYTCQAYNGYGKVAIWSVMVQALGLVNSTNDNDAAARGHNYKDCGCQDTHYGCCPDNYTAAVGEDYNGCLCHTFQFGCCPDGVTIAKGPHKRETPSLDVVLTINRQRKDLILRVVDVHLPNTVAVWMKQWKLKVKILKDAWKIQEIYKLVARWIWIEALAKIIQLNGSTIQQVALVLISGTVGAVEIAINTTPKKNVKMYVLSLKEKPDATCPNLRVHVTSTILSGIMIIPIINVHNFSMVVVWETTTDLKYTMSVLCYVSKILILVPADYQK